MQGNVEQVSAGQRYWITCITPRLQLHAIQNTLGQRYNCALSDPGVLFSGWVNLSHRLAFQDPHQAAVAPPLALDERQGIGAH